MYSTQDEDWCECSECEKYYSLPLRDIRFRSEQRPLRCPFEHVLSYYPNSVRWQRLTGIYYLLASSFPRQEKVISFAQVHEILPLIPLFARLAKLPQSPQNEQGEA